MIDGEYCYVCQNPYTEVHHIYYGAKNRKRADELGYTVHLCRIHHEEVHRHPNHGLDLLLKKLGQQEWEKTKTRKQFIETFGMNYLEEEE
jgi:hypothetical protein